MLPIIHILVNTSTEDVIAGGKYSSYLKSTDCFTSLTHTASLSGLASEYWTSADWFVSRSVRVSVVWAGNTILWKSCCFKMAWDMNAIKYQTAYRSFLMEFSHQIVIWCLNFVFVIVYLYVYMYYT